MESYEEYTNIWHRRACKAKVHRYKVYWDVAIDKTNVF
jgi:hypothetical protein